MKEKPVTVSRRKYDAAFKEEVLQMVFNGRTVSEVARSLGIGENIIYRWKSRHKNYKSVQLDEVWAFVDRKRKRWLFYAYAPETGEVLAWSWGNRSQHTVRRLYRQLEPLNIGWLCTDDWPAFTKVLPEEKHLVGKAYTRNIEGVNLCLRTRNRRMVRKTACFSKNEQNHYNARKPIFTT